MGNIGCCLWWLVFGLLVGFVLSWFLGHGSRRSGSSATGAVAGSGAAAMQTSELQRLRAELDRLNAAHTAEGSQLSALRAELASAAGAHHDELDQLHAELLAARAQLAKELSAHSADAQKLAALGSSAAAAAYGFVPKTRSGEDDLAIVEGIGPKIAELLRSNGIRTFEQLAATPAARLHDILAAAGPRFKIANHPDTWPSQAELCAKGQWEDLRKVQEGLTTHNRRFGGPNQG
jgi:predicted flap endonuclease-1-like 5' DNA nuclease